MADNYTALKSAQKKRYISKETFNSLDLSQIPVGSEYEVVSPIEKGDLSADINNALNKAEKSISEPTNQTTGSDGDVLVKKGGGSEWSGNVAKLDGNNEFSGNNIFDKPIIIYGNKAAIKDVDDNTFYFPANLDRPGSTYTLALKEDVDAKSSFSVEVW